ncbi:CcoQ/FixQ family Cbb3-type cytochrome c oxidase assembly chaperone [Simonsiella muelleri]|jgi:hypothetical protein|uniref:Cytochrome c oxidase, cbb3-type, CcoQ subunit n=1 Tax=Simonsiella muelleri ATCC 29453 TaxID=641147 RepID=V9HDM2_9NEIS|nr:hypothetical protein [Simonsiella muelleri]AUX60812.1 cytochrome C oxidase subunit IV [Simonsiella muelleri ATCC 29453]EFG31611.1 hypothetical protein HMPREF9021_00006 [Simonsiella muelleri ATCC 29453]UBQ54364.1 CcoQ/FixQ family Cbb3-type cytochrome c oxidase assembly chaperone [Simonsiella muelleri]
MDLTWARVLFTLLVFNFFVLMLYIVYHKRNKSGYQEVGQSIIDDPDTPAENVHSNPDNGAK